MWEGTGQLGESVELRTLPVVEVCGLVSVLPDCLTTSGPGSHGKTSPLGWQERETQCASERGGGVGLRSWKGQLAAETGHWSKLYGFWCAVVPGEA